MAAYKSSGCSEHNNGKQNNNFSFFFKFIHLLKIASRAGHDFQITLLYNVQFFYFNKFSLL